MDLPTGVSLSFFGSFVLGTAEFSLTEIPMQHIVERVQNGRYDAKPARVFPFNQLPAAHRLMESNQANRKIVVAMDDHVKS